MPNQFTSTPVTDNVTTFTASAYNTLQSAVQYMPVPIIPWKTQRLYSPITILAGYNPAFTALTANRHYVHWFMAPTDTPVDQVAVEVLTAVAASTCRIGLYAAGSDFWPGALTTDWGTVDTSTTGIKTIALTGVTLLAGVVYYVVAAPTAAISVRAHQVVLALFGAATIGSGSGVSVPFTSRASDVLVDPFGAPGGGTNTAFVYLRAT